VPLEHLALHVARRKVVVVVEPDLADRYDTLFASQPRDLRECRIVAMLRVVRMKAHPRPHVRVGLGDGHGLRRILELRARHHEPDHPRRPRRREIRLGIGHGQVAVRVGETHQCRTARPRIVAMRLRKTREVLLSSSARRV
jgi:hypothetical protein